MHKIYRALFLILLVSQVIAQPLRFYDKIDTIRHGNQILDTLRFTAMDVAGDDKGGWLTLGAQPDSTFSIIQFDYCGKVITNQKYHLPDEFRLSTPQIIYLGKDTALVYATLKTNLDSRILIFYSVGGIIQLADYLVPDTGIRYYNPMISVYDHDNILLGFNSDSSGIINNRLVMLNKNLNARWKRTLNSQSELGWIQMIDKSQFAVGYANTVKKFDTLGINLWTRTIQDRNVGFNSVLLQQDSNLIFLAEFIDTSSKNFYQQLVCLDTSGKFKWQSDLIRNFRRPYQLNYNSRLLFDKNKNIVYTSLDTLPGDPVPYIYGSTFDANGTMQRSKHWTAKDSVIEYNASLLSDGDFCVNILTGDSQRLWGFANIKLTQQFESCETKDTVPIKFNPLHVDSTGSKNIGEFALIELTTNIKGNNDTLLSNRICEIFDLKDGDVPIDLCKGDSVFIAGLMIPNATYHWDNGTNQQGIFVKVAGSYKLTITYCAKTVVITYNVKYITYKDVVEDVAICDYPYHINGDQGPGALHSWNTGDKTASINVAGPGTYVDTVTKCEMRYLVTHNVTLKQFKDEAFEFKICDYPNQLYAYQGNDIHGATYLWDDGSTGSARVIDSPGVYKVVVSYCMSMFTQTFTVRPREVTDSIFNFKICDYPNTIYAFQGPTIKDASYVWEDGSTNGSRIINGPGTYKVTVDYCKTKFTETFNITLREFADSVFNFQICDYPNTIYAFQGPDIHGAKYVWEDGSTNGSRGITGPGIYKVTVDYCMSKFTETFNITRRQFGDSIFTFRTCDTTFTLYAFQGPDIHGAKYLWQDSSTKGFLTVDTIGNYKVTVNYCNQQFTETFHLIAGPDDRLTGQFGDSTIKVTCKNLVLYGHLLHAYKDLDPLVNLQLSYIWNKNKNLTKDTLRVYEFGVDTATIRYCYNDYKQAFVITDSVDYLIFPNIFPPNSNEMINRTFRPFMKDSVADYKLEIFNRWGKKVYTGVDVNVGWDGNYDGDAGHPAPMDTYMYIVSFRSRCDDKSNFSKKGTFTLIR